MSRLGRVRGYELLPAAVVLLVVLLVLLLLLLGSWVIGLRQFESIVAKSGRPDGRPSRGLGSQESIRKRRAGLAVETGRAGEPGSQVPWGCLSSSCGEWEWSAHV